MEIQESQLAKLPKWAQTEIKRLRANEASYLRQLRVGPEDSDTFASPYSNAKRPLGRGTAIEFVMPSDDIHTGEARITVRVDGDHLEVYGSDGALCVQPSSSNTLKLRVGEYMR